MIKKLWREVGIYKKESLLSPFFVILEVVMEVLIPFFMAEILDEGIANGNMPLVWKMGIILVGASMLSLLFGVLAGKFAATAAAGFSKNLRRDMFYNIQRFSFSNIDKFSTPSLVTRLTTDVTNVQNAYQMLIRVAIRGPIMMIFAMIMAMQVNVQLSLIFLVAIVVLGAGLLLIILKAHPHFEEVFRKYDTLNQVVQENVTAVRVVKAYVREEKEEEKFHHISTDVYNRFKIAEKIVALNAPLMQFVMYTVILLICWFAAQFIVVGGMTTGELMSMIVYASQILSSLMMLSMVFVMVMIAEASAERIVEVLDEKSDMQNCEQPKYELADGSVEFCGVDFSYVGDEEKLALEGVDLSIRSGETVGIIGGTGSAKSTFVQLIPRLYDVTRGCVKVGGADVREYDLDTLRDQVAVVLQKNVLFHGTIKENLRWGKKDATDEELVRVCKLAQADEFVSSFPDGYDTMIEQGGTNVSGGQKQRLCIARALLKKPKVLILDDSTSAVDTRTDALIRKAFREEIPDTTKFIIAQRIASVEDADKIIVLDDGKVVAFGSPAELYETSPIYREVYESQKKGGSGDDRQ